MDGIRHVFDHFDENKDGLLSRHELRRSLQMLGIQLAGDEEILEMVKAADANSDGFLDFVEFASFYNGLIASVGEKSTEIDGSSSSEAAALFQEENEEKEEGDEEEEIEEDLRDAFNLFDKNGDGFISAEELHSVLTSMGLSQGKLLSDCRNMIRSVDADGDGRVSFCEFKHMMLLPEA